MVLAFIVHGASTAPKEEQFMLCVNGSVSSRIRYTPGAEAFFLSTKTGYGPPSSGARCDCCVLLLWFVDAFVCLSGPSAPRG